jgi:hypothetical protein
MRIVSRTPHIDEGGADSQMDMNRAHRGAGQRGSDAFDHCCIAADEEEYRSEHHLTERWCRERGHRIDLLSICHSLLAPLSNRRGIPTPPAIRSRCGSSESLRARPTPYGPLPCPCLGLSLCYHRACRRRCVTGQRLRYGKARLRRQRWHAQRISTTMTQPHQQYSCHRGRQPTRHCTVPTIHLHVNFSPLKFATSYAHRSPFDSTRYLSRTPTIGEDLEEPPTVHDDA